VAFNQHWEACFAFISKEILLKKFNKLLTSFDLTMMFAVDSN
jgi:hypothetical protein